MGIGRWKRELLFLVPSITGVGTGSLFFTDANQKYGNLKFKLGSEINDFIQASSEGQNKTFKPTDLLKEMSYYSETVPILTRAMAIQIAKQIFNGQLYKKTKYEDSLGKVFPHELRKKHREIKGHIKQRQSRSTRIRKEWIQDESKYLTELQDYVLNKIDHKSIQEHFSVAGDDHLFKGTKLKNHQKTLTPLMGFLLGNWIEQHKAGYYVHKTIPYADAFTEKTKEFYEKKYPNINLPAKPNYFFPDYDRSKYDGGENPFQEAINDWRRGTSYFESFWTSAPKDRSEEVKNETKIAWISSTNNSHKNIALRYLAHTSQNTNKARQKRNTSSSEPKDSKSLTRYWKQLRPWFMRWRNDHSCSLPTQDQDEKMSEFSIFLGEITSNPMSLFCINNKGTEHPEFLVFTPEKDDVNSKRLSSKIVFYRDEKGFNVLYPIKKSLIEDKKSQNDQQGESLTAKSEIIIEQFKQYVKENFEFLLLKYHSFIKDGHSHSKTASSTHTTSTKPCCDEIIKKLIEIIELSQKLKDWNDIWKSYDIRKHNNSILKVDTSSSKTGYFNKVGTASYNPPKFLGKRLEKDLKTLSELLKPINAYISDVSKYFDDKGGGNLQEKKETGKDGKKYWIVEKMSNTAPNKKDDDCMKAKVARYLLESISTRKLLQKFLILPMAFENSRHWLTTQVSSSSSGSSPTPSTGTENINNILEAKFQKYLGLDSGNNSSNGGVPKLVKKLIQLIKKENILSKVSDMSDTTLYHLTKSQADESQKWENIENFLTLTGLSASKNQLHEQLKTLITAIYLIENSFEEYRELIRRTIRQEGFGAYAFTLSWNKFCRVDEYLLNPIQKVESESFWTPQEKLNKDQSGEWDSKVLDSRQCIKTSDRLATSSIKKRHQKSSAPMMLLNFLISVWDGISTNKSLKHEKMMGFKGLVSRRNMNNLPSDFYNKIFSFLYKEGHLNWDDIKAQIRNFKTNTQLTSYVEKIKQINSSIGQTFEFTDLRRKFEDTDEAKNVSDVDWLNLQRRKDLLIKFIDDTILKKDEAQENDTQEKERLRKLNKKRFQGLLFDHSNKENSKKTHIFNQGEESSIAYLLQVTTDDLKDRDSFYRFVEKHLTPEMLLQDIVKQSQSRSLQMRAINYFLSRGTWANNKKVFNLKSGDYFLKDQCSSIITV